MDLNKGEVTKNGWHSNNGSQDRQIKTIKWKSSGGYLGLHGDARIYRDFLHQSKDKYNFMNDFIIKYNKYKLIRFNGNHQWIGFYKLYIKYIS